MSSADTKPRLKPATPMRSSTRSPRTATTANLSGPSTRAPPRAVELHAFFSMCFGAGGGMGQNCAVTDDGVSCTLEYNCIRWGQFEMPPQAGMAVFEHGPDGLLVAARAYDEIEAPSSLDGCHNDVRSWLLPRAINVQRPGNAPDRVGAAGRRPSSTTVARRRPATDAAPQTDEASGEAAAAMSAATTSEIRKASVTSAGPTASREPGDGGNHESGWRGWRCGRSRC